MWRSLEGPTHQQPEMDKPIYLRSCHSFRSLVFLILKVIKSILAMGNQTPPKISKTKLWGQGGEDIAFLSRGVPMFEPILGWILGMDSVSSSLTFHDQLLVGTEILFRAVWIVRLIVLDALLYLKNNVHKESICSLKDNQCVSYINGTSVVFNLC